MTNKKEILKDMAFCQELMNRLVDYTKKMRFIFSMIKFRPDDLKYIDYK